jgi:hypothetical protein
MYLIARSELACMAVVAAVIAIAAHDKKSRAEWGLAVSRALGRDRQPPGVALLLSCVAGPAGRSGLLPADGFGFSAGVAGEG